MTVPRRTTQARTFPGASGCRWPSDSGAPARTREERKEGTRGADAPRGEMLVVQQLHGQRGDPGIEPDALGLRLDADDHPLAVLEGGRAPALAQRRTHGEAAVRAVEV